MTAFRISVLLLAVLPSLASTGAAQFEQSNLVAGTGTATLTRMPETMRLQVSLIGRGATLKDALAALKDRTTRAQTQLISLGAEKESIKVGDARLSEMPNNRNSQMQMMMMQRMKRGGKTKDKAPAAPPVLVTAQLSAQWKLSSKTSEELLLAIHPVQEKIKAADLAGSKEAEKLTPEQEEMLEEAEQNFMYGSSDESKPGEPVFLFVSKVSEVEYEKALAEAFEKARTQATRLAKAAGSKLGSLKSLNNFGAAASGYEDFESGLSYNSPAYRALQIARRQIAGLPNDESYEAIGVEPGMVKYNVSITAAFNLEQKE
jgi:hypothetical protein